MSSPSKLHNFFHSAATPADDTADAGRRSFVRGSVALAAGAAGLGALGLSGCGGSDMVVIPVSFSHGVASGDPQAERVILWTRVRAKDSADLRDLAVRWEVASDADFKTIVASGDAQAAAARDYTVKVDATGLQAGQKYFYRFSCESQYSPVGRTKTLPTGTTVSQVKLAVFSCANYPAGYFNVYAEAAKREDIDVAVHLGDYIYEYGRGGYASEKAAALGREVEPAGEIVALNDYRRRYAQYRADADLQRLHANVPMIAIWDDHEVCNDSWTDGAENHQPATEGDYAKRKAAAIQAYHEWMPIRSQQSAELIYRSFAFGNLLSLHMLDTRLIGREEPLDYAKYTSASGFNASAFGADLAKPNRQLLGATQTGWLQQQLSTSSATWQVLGQQVLMGRMNIPAPILFEANNPGSGVSVSAYGAIVAKAQSNPASLSAQERAILAQPSIPYNLDAWDGYAAARETVLATARQLNKNLVVLAGDTHNAWASDLQDMAGNQVGVEFATSSVTSPGFEVYLPKENPAQLAGALTQLIGPLEYADTSRRGFMVLTVTAQECRSDWVYVSTITSREYTASVGKSLKVLPGQGQRKLTAV
ncbi:alkaline phosphatase D family protein [Paucibacter sp. DJ2R-2]|uniref:alkaline phosphatase D family protein n=1 Tax=Paucibacter sp. DJ2R-2 TaxID=2893558 RepID=UPI0021E3AC7D|nr:alkaline phosphatase D family protein [Paucibacter sp. DJ2R-2]MCV2419758.1 alkaline phosphatase D family protein [Paucibacter sp. DJ4R-1]MCV2437339.1 alkaline phosphatase D family protein [Paucibacter sp. DJ2R-2]